MFNFDFDLKKIHNFYTHNEKTVRMAALILVVGLSILFFWIHGDSRTVEIEEGADETALETAYESYEDQEEVKTSSDSPLYVDISGEVFNPGVYKVTAGTRLFEVIEMAGGLTDEADLSSLNRAEKVSDGQKVIVRSVEEAGSGADPYVYAIDDSFSADEEKVNINTADSAELQTIPGIGPSKAASIIEYREQNGYFADIEEIMNVRGIGQKTFDSIKDILIV